MPEHPLAAMNRIDPEFMGNVRKMDEAIFADGALARKHKLLIAMAFDAAHGADMGVRALAQAAVKAGATQQEVAEALRVAYHLSGVGSLYTASQGLKELFP